MKKLLLAVALLITPVAIAQQGPVQVIPEASMPTAGDSCPANFGPGLMARENGRMMTCRSLTWQTLDTFDVLAYGATCGGTDQEGEINAAITAANAAGGGVVSVPPNCTLGVDGQIILKANVALRCADNVTSLIRKDWSGTSFGGSTLVTDDLDATPTKQDNVSVVNCNFDYASTCGGGSDPCEGGILHQYGDQFLAAYNRGDWYEDKAFGIAGDLGLITENALIQTTGVGGDDGIRLIADGDGTLVTGNRVESFDDCYDPNFVNSGSILANVDTHGTNWINNYCESTGGRMWTAAALSGSTASIYDQTVIGMYGSADQECIFLFDEEGAAQDQIYNISISDVICTAATGGDQSDSTDEGVQIDSALNVKLDRLTIDGFNNDGLRILDSKDVTVTQSSFDGSTIDGDDGASAEPVVQASNGNTSIHLDDLTVTMATNLGTSQQGVQLGIGGNTCVDCSLTNSTIYVGDNGVGIILDGADDAKVYGNTVSEISGETSTTCFQATANSDYAQIIGNDFDGCDTVGTVPSRMTALVNDGITLSQITDDGNSPRFQMRSEGASGVPYFELSNALTANGRVGELRWLNDGNVIGDIYAERVGSDDEGHLVFQVADSAGTVIHSMLRKDGDIWLEGDTNDGFETILSPTDPTADETITIPNLSGTIAVGCSIMMQVVTDPTETDATTEYFNIGPQATMSAAGAGTQTDVDLARAPTDVSVESIRIDVSQGPGSGDSRTYTLYDDGSSTSATCSVDDTDTFCVFSGSVSIAAGSKLSMEHVTSCGGGCAVTSEAYISVCMVPE